MVSIDFINLNKACPKVYFPLPRNDQLVDFTIGHELLSLMDAYYGYNQIKMHKPDQAKTIFKTNMGLYCCTIMSFGLKNAQTTYQCLVNMMVFEQIGRTMEVYIYVDDMLVKSKQVSDHVKNLKKSSDVLRKYKMRLNPKKCIWSSVWKISRLYG